MLCVLGCFTLSASGVTVTVLRYPDLTERWLKVTKTLKVHVILAHSMSCLSIEYTHGINCMLCFPFFFFFCTRIRFCPAGKTTWLLYYSKNITLRGMKNQNLYTDLLKTTEDELTPVMSSCDLHTVWQNTIPDILYLYLPLLYE